MIGHMIALIAICVLSTVVRAQTPTVSLTGTWEIVSANDMRADGTINPLYGPSPSGVLMFDSAGRYSLQLCAAGRPKYAAGDRQKGTPEEYRAVATGCNPHWGTYILDETSHTIVFRIEHALFTNWEGTEQKRRYALNGDQLSYQVPNAATAANNPVIVWRRLK